MANKVNGCYFSIVQKKTNKAHPSIIKSASHGSGGWIKAFCIELMYFVRKISIFKTLKLKTFFKSMVFLQNWATSTLLPRVETTPEMWYLASRMQILPGEPHQKMCILPPGMRFFNGGPPSKRDWAGLGLAVSSNWAGFVVKTWQPCVGRRLWWEVTNA